MRPASRLLLLAGCVLVAALVCPGAARVAAEDLLGPYAPDADASVTLLADARRFEVLEPTNHDDGDAGPDDEHDSP